MRMVKTFCRSLLGFPAMPLSEVQVGDTWGFFSPGGALCGGETVLWTVTSIDLKAGKVTMFCSSRHAHNDDRPRWWAEDMWPILRGMTYRGRRSVAPRQSARDGYLAALDAGGVQAASAYLQARRRR